MADGPLERLQDRLAAEDRLLVAFSGGADSALLAKVASDVLGERAVAVTAVSASLPARERALAADFCRDQGISHVEVLTDEITRDAFRANGGDRCFHCKSALFDALEPLRRLAGAVVALGTNMDDVADHRPGQAAAAARGAIAPLLDAGLRKADVRAVSRSLGLLTADKPATACLSSRVAYGEPVTTEVLAKIEAAENAMHDLGFQVCRVRSHAHGTVARIEVPSADLGRAVGVAQQIDLAMREAGFTFCGIDPVGFVSGRLNVLLGMPRPSGL